MVATAPEELDNNGRVLPRLTLALQLDTGHENEVAEVLKTRLLTNTDRHEIFKEIGEDLDFLGEDVTARAFVSTWANFHDAAVLAFSDPVSSQQPLLSAAS